MSGVPLLGNVDCPWFDPNWPFVGNLDRRWASGSVIHPELTRLSLSEVMPVAMFAGWMAPNWKVDGHAIPQQMLGTVGDQWLILIGCLPNDSFRPDAPVGWINSEERMLDCGTEGHEETLSGYWCEGDEKFEYQFFGDTALAIACDWLAEYGFVQSKYWPVLVQKNPQLRKMVQYLVAQRVLFPDGTHPSHSDSREPEPLVNRINSPCVLNQEHTLRLWELAKAVQYSSGNCAEYLKELRRELSVVTETVVGKPTDWIAQSNPVREQIDFMLSDGDWADDRLFDLHAGYVGGVGWAATVWPYDPGGLSD
jgi:hypothetical protein